MLKKVLKYITIAAILCYLTFAFVFVPLKKDYDNCNDIAINITNNKFGTISNSDIVDMLVEEGLHPQGKMMDSIECHKIEKFIKELTLIKECQVYKTNGNSIRMDVVCREPLLKVHDKNGAVYYLDIEGEKIDDIKKPLLLPVVSGEIDDSMIEKELHRLVVAIAKDPFWLAQIQQIYLNEKKEAIVTPRMGDHIIELGSTKQLDEKFNNLKTFYTKGLNTVGWNKYDKINIKISNKVICTKREN